LANIADEICDAVEVGLIRVDAAFADARQMDSKSHNIALTRSTVILCEDGMKRMAEQIRKCAGSGASDYVAEFETVSHGLVEALVSARRERMKGRTSMRGGVDDRWMGYLEELAIALEGVRMAAILNLRNASPEPQADLRWWRRYQREIVGFILGIGASITTAFALRFLELAN